MFDSKYSKVLTVILVIVIIAIIGLLGFLGYNYYKNYVLSKDAAEAVENFEGKVTTGDGSGTSDNGDGSETPVLDKLTNPDGTSDDNSTSSSELPKYKGFDMLGTINIPKTKCEYPILLQTGAKALDTAVVYSYGPGLNEVGDSVIAGHNYRNGKLFSNNKNLSNGDKIYITDNSKRKLTYEIYETFITGVEDTSFYQRDTQGKPEITLSTCTDASNNQRFIIKAKLVE